MPAQPRGRLGPGRRRGTPTAAVQRRCPGGQSGEGPVAEPLGPATARYHSWSRSVDLALPVGAGDIPWSPCVAGLRCDGRPPEFLGRTTRGFVPMGEHVLPKHVRPQLGSLLASLASTLTALVRGRFEGSQVGQEALP